MAEVTEATTLLQTFGTADMTLFLVSMALGLFIGIYFAYFAPKSSNEEVDYLVGGRNMGMFPVSLSLVASHISGISLLGVPSEVNVYGCQAMYNTIPYWLGTYIFVTQMLPLFHDLQGLSLNEYFVKRFDRRVRILASVLFFTHTMGWLPIVIYVPALAFQQVTGYSVNSVTPVVCLVCIFYTSMGGIKAVVWTDVVQLFSMFICVILVAAKGTYDVGGPSVVWERNVASGRIEAPYIDFDPTVRHTFFGIFINEFIHHLRSGCLSQDIMQRYLALNTLEKAKKTAWIYTIVVVFLIFLSGYCGLIIAAAYYDCDPFSIGLVRTKDQMVPLFVMQSIGIVPGLAGLYISGIFSAALSSLSTRLNSMSAIFMEDWIRGCTSWNPTDHQATWMMRIFVVVLGLVIVVLVNVVEKLGMVLQMSSSIGSISGGPLFSVFVLGLFFPWVTTSGALAGAVGAILGVAPLIFSNQYAVSQKQLLFPAKPVSLDGCIQTYNVSAQFMESVRPPPETLVPMGPIRGDVVYPLRISYLWFTPIGVTCGVITAILWTLFVSRADLRKVDRRLIAPFSRRWLPKSADDSPMRGKHVVISTDCDEPAKTSV